MNKRFDGVLLCTDWDGTFCIGDSIPKDNIDAVRYFEEKGGLFTVASGRFPSYLEPFWQQTRINAPLVSLNGALIYDCETQKTVKEGFISKEAFLLAQKILDRNIPYFDVTAYYAMAVGGKTETFSPSEFKNKTPLLQKQRIYKLLLKTDTEERGILGQRFASSLHFSQFETVRSWNISLEIIQKDYNKASATRFLKNKLCADTLICVGDYENDISMLENADISYAVGNAAPSVKQVAKHLTIDAKDGAIADIISRI